MQIYYLNLLQSRLECNAVCMRRRRVAGVQLQCMGARTASFKVAGEVRPVDLRGVGGVDGGAGEVPLADVGVPGLLPGQPREHVRVIRRQQPRPLPLYHTAPPISAITPESEVLYKENLGESSMCTTE